MKRVLYFGARIPGRPVRAKHAPVIRGGHAATRPLDSWREWRDRVVPLLRVAALERGVREPLADPAFVRVTAVFPRPAKPRRTYTVRGETRPYRWSDGRVPFVGRPDVDQIEKAALDVLVQAGILLDDQLVVETRCERWYAAPGEEPAVIVRLYPWWDTA